MLRTAPRNGSDPAAAAEAAFERPRSFGWHLAMLTLGVLIPALIYIAFLLYQYAEAERSRTEEMARGLARTLSVAVDREIVGVATTLQALATSPSLANGDLRRFYAQGQEIRRQQGFHVSVRSADGVAILATRLPFGQSVAAGSAEVQAADDEARRMGKPVTSDVFIGALNRRPTIQIAAPVLSDPQPQRVVGASLETEYFRDLLGRFGTPEGWTIAIVDAEGAVVARLPDHERFSGRPASADFRERAIEAQGVYYGVNAAGVPSLVAYARSASTDWRVGVNYPAAAINAALWRSVASLALAGLLLGCLAALSAGLVRRRLLRAMAALTGTAAALGHGEAPPAPSTPLEEADQLGQAMSEAALRLRDGEDRLRHFASSNVVGILHGDVEGGIADANDEFLRIVGRTRAELEAGRLRWDAITPPEWLPVDAERIREAQQAGACGPYEKEYLRPNGTRVPVIVGFSLSGEGRSGSVAFVLDISRQKELEEEGKLLVKELHHRIKNTLAVVQAIAASTLRTASDPDAFRTAFADRLASLGRTHAMLTDNGWSGADLRALIALETASFAEAGRVKLDGADVPLPPEMASALGMAVHELVTNAVKHGALSAPGGQVEVAWRVEPREGERRLFLRWVERGGPPACEPGRRGFGLQVLEQVLGRQVGGTASMSFAPAGFEMAVDALLPPGGGIGRPGRGSRPPSPGAR